MQIYAIRGNFIQFDDLPTTKKSLKLRDFNQCRRRFQPGRRTLHKIVPHQILPAIVFCGGCAGRGSHAIKKWWLQISNPAAAPLVTAAAANRVGFNLEVCDLFQSLLISIDRGFISYSPKLCVTTNARLSLRVLTKNIFVQTFNSTYICIVCASVLNNVIAAILHHASNSRRPFAVAGF